jgi:hypothetical protein
MSKGPPQLAGSINPIVDSIVGRFCTVLATKFYKHTERTSTTSACAAPASPPRSCTTRCTTPWAIDNELANRVVQRWTFAAEADYLSVFGTDGTIKDPNNLSQRAIEVIRELEAGAKKQAQRNDLRPGKGNGNGKGKGRANGRRSGGKPRQRSGSTRRGQGQRRRWRQCQRRWRQCQRR